MKQRAQLLQWDIFCKVIDNFGDIGVSWRLAADLASRGHRVRLWVDDGSALAWMAPAGCAGVSVQPWTQALLPAQLQALQDSPCEVLIEAFGCQIAPEFIAACTRSQSAGALKPVWINLEYLSAQAYAERSHGLPSPVQSGPAAGWTKWFFYPGFSARTGGLLREPALLERQASFQREDWLRGLAITLQGEMLVSMFCYEPGALIGLLRQLARSGLQGKPVRLLVAAGRAQHAVAGAMVQLNAETDDEIDLQRPTDGRGQLSISYLPLLSQMDFDHLLWSCDLNFVRGEDSVVRALWAGKALVWQIYPQGDGAHLAKLDAFLDMLQAPDSLRDFHHDWNASAPENPPAGPKGLGKGRAELLVENLPAWGETVEKARARLLQQDDLSTSLLQFVAKNR